MHILLRLAGYGLRYRRLLILAWISLLGANILALAMPWVIGVAVDGVLGRERMSQLLLLALLLLLLSLVRGVFSYGQTYLAEGVSARVAYDLRNALLAKLQRLSFAFHDRQKTGDLMSLVTYDVESTRMFISFGLVRSLQLMLLIGGVTPLLMLLHWQLGLLSMAAVPLTIYISFRVSQRLRWIWLSIQRQMGQVTTLLQENLTGMRVVKTFGAEKFQEEVFNRRASKVAEESFIANRLWTANSSFLSFMFLLATVAVIWYGGSQVIDGNLTAGELTQFLLYLGLLVMPIRMLGWAVNSFSRAISSGERIFQVLDSHATLKEKVGAIELKDVKGSVSFEEVSFSYSPGMPALSKVSFDIYPGQKVAVLGAPGSGKSTIVNLVPRFYDTGKGTVKIDGIDVRDVTLDSLRKNVGIVFQDLFLFHTSIRENIAYGVNGASFDQIEGAARVAQLHDFIMSLPEGYESIVGERGVTLSGGQRQRLAIARTLLLDPPILVLDDSTSSIDVETEALIRRALVQVMKDRTTFIIAHRVSSVREADLILVLKEGEIATRGTHEELLTSSAFYRQIYELQLVPEEQVLLEAASADGDGSGVKE